MQFLLSLVFVLLFASNAWAQACNYYASPTGLSTNSGLDTNNPITITKFYTIVAASQMPGKTLCLMNGTYQGADYVINPGDLGPVNLSGTASLPITIRALNDGLVTIDGQFTRRPVNLGGIRNSVPHSNDYWVLEGFNAKQGTREVIQFYRSAGNIIRRVVAWDGEFSKGTAIFINNVNGREGPANLIEDSAFFGTSGITVHHYGGSGTAGSIGLTLRRVWCRNEGGSSNTAQKECIQAGYGGTPNHRCENCLITWSEASYPASWNVTNSVGTAINSSSTDNDNCPGWGIVSTPFCIDGFYRLRARPTDPPTAGNPPPTVMNSRVYGSLGYLNATERFSGDQLFGKGSVFHVSSGGHRLIGMHIEDAWVLVHPSNPDFNDIWGFVFTTQISDVTLTHATSVRGAGDAVTATPWVVTDLQAASSIAGLQASAQSPWTSTTGGNLCFRWTPGGTTPSTVPLWPWPMNQRIKDATTTAGRAFGTSFTATAGSNGNPCVNCSGPPLARPIADVTADIQALGGAIPPQCLQGAIEPFPEDAGFTTPLLSTFTGADGVIPNFVSVVGSGVVISSNKATPGLVDANTHVARYITDFDQKQEVYYDIATLVAEDGNWYQAQFLGVDQNNRVFFACTRVTGVNNDTCRIARRIDGIYSEPLAPVNLGWDMAVGDKFGGRYNDNDNGLASLIYCRASNGICYRIGQAPITNAPNGGFIGIGLGGAAQGDNFGGGNLSGDPPDSPIVGVGHRGRIH